MSNGLAIAAVTTTLTRLLERLPKEPPDPADPFDVVEVTARPLDKASQSVQRDRLNLFLYQTALNGAWRNTDMPLRTGGGHPPLALDLSYLLSAFSDSLDDHRSHQLLGRAMRLLHDHALLGREEIKTALELSELHAQIDRIRIVPVPMSLEELSKLWTAFQTQYRLSAAYQVSVVLIESRRPPSSPLPVLRRGAEDQGVTAVASPGPTLHEARPPVPLPSARLGDDITLVGANLSGAESLVRFANPHLEAPVTRPPAAGGTPETLKVTFGDAQEAGLLARWVPGFYTVSLVVTRANLPSWTTNEVPLGLAPRITVSPLTAAPGDVGLTITARPRIRNDQRVLLLVSGIEAGAPPGTPMFAAQLAPVTRTTPADEGEPTTLTFMVPALKRGTYTVRLRVDGVDSIPLPPPQADGQPQLAFDRDQQVVVA
jgi:hypothetical protein